MSFLWNSAPWKNNSAVDIWRFLKWFLKLGVKWSVPNTQHGMLPSSQQYHDGHPRRGYWEKNRPRNVGVVPCFYDQIEAHLYKSSRFHLAKCPFVGRHWLYTSAKKWSWVRVGVGGRKSHCSRRSYMRCRSTLSVTCLPVSPEMGRLEPNEVEAASLSLVLGLLRMSPTSLARSTRSLQPVLQSIIYHTTCGSKLCIMCFVIALLCLTVPQLFSVNFFSPPSFTISFTQSLLCCLHTHTHLSPTFNFHP